MRSELIFRTQLTAQVKVSTIPFPFKHSLLEKQNLRFFFSTRFLFNFFRPNSIKIFYVLDYFLQTGLISAAVGLALKGFFFFFFQPCSLLPFTDTIVSLWSLCARTMDVNLPPWIPPQPTICQRGTKSDVRSIMSSLGESCSRVSSLSPSPPPARFP